MEIAEEAENVMNAIEETYNIMKGLFSQSDLENLLRQIKEVYNFSEMTIKKIENRKAAIRQIIDNDAESVPLNEKLNNVSIALNPMKKVIDAIKTLMDKTKKGDYTNWDNELIKVRKDIKDAIIAINNSAIVEDAIEARKKLIAILENIVTRRNEENAKLALEALAKDSQENKSCDHAQENASDDDLDIGYAPWRPASEAKENKKYTTDDVSQLALVQDVTCPLTSAKQESHDNGEELIQADNIIDDYFLEESPLPGSQRASFSNNLKEDGYDLLNADY